MKNFDLFDMTVTLILSFIAGAIAALILNSGGPARVPSITIVDENDKPRVVKIGGHAIDVETARKTRDVYQRAIEALEAKP